MATTQLRFTAQDRRQQIMELAAELFAHQGFDGTTTREIAERAGVNEALIFRHFPSKEDLYWAIIDGKCQAGGMRGQVAATLQSNAPDVEIFASIAEDILRRREKDTAMTRLLLFTALENHRLSRRFFRKHVAELYELLSEYIRKRMDAGVFRPANPLIAARAFLGMVFYHNLIQNIFGANHYQKFDIKEVSKTLAGIWLQGMLPPNPERSGRSPERGLNYSSPNGERARK